MNRMFPNLRFSNSIFNRLPIDPNPENEIRRILPNAIFSRVVPTPVLNPQLVATSPSALELIGIAKEDTRSPEFVEYLAGNRLFEGGKYLAHCYCGHQFGYFAGQLGDGAAMLVGRIESQDPQHPFLELQFKGSGLTPYSRGADGRKVLRSSLREFLCSEAMHYLNIPTTRSGSLITSDTRVERDPLYDGHPVQERASVITRIAPSFLRFGSFEICNPVDEESGNGGPNPGNVGLLRELALFAIETQFPHLWREHQEERRKEESGEEQDSRPLFLAFYKEVVERTASLVALWQCVGFCHGVLNTDNLSILGLTIDYGPFGFMELMDPTFVCNGSDHGGRYSYENQPGVVKWNCRKLMDALLPLFGEEEGEGGEWKEKLSRVLQQYDVWYSKAYYQQMKKKLGLSIPPPSPSSVADSSVAAQELAKDQAELISELFAVMEDTGSDFTNTFRALLAFPYPNLHVEEEDDAVQASETEGDERMKVCSPEDFERTERDRFLSLLVEASSVSLDYQRRRLQPKASKEQITDLIAMVEQQPAVVHVIGVSKEFLQQQLALHEKKEQLESTYTTDEEKQEENKQKWAGWVQRYWGLLVRTEALRCQQETEQETEQEEKEGEQDSLRAFKEHVRTRWETMRLSNPRLVLRNFVAQEAIERAEEGDFREVRDLLERLKRPYDDDDDDEEEGAGKGRGFYTQNPPEWTAGLCVTCSS